MRAFQDDFDLGVDHRVGQIPREGSGFIAGASKQ
jgi:hypothetical protein